MKLLSPAFINSQQLKNCLPFIKYAVSEGIVLHVVYYSEYLPELTKKSGGLEKSEVWNLGSLIVPLMSAITWAQTTMWLKIKSFVFSNNKLQLKNKQTNKQHTSLSINFSTFLFFAYMPLCTMYYSVIVVLRSDAQSDELYVQ